VNAIKRALAQSDVSSVDVNILASTATVFHDPNVSRSGIKSLIESTGVKVVERESFGFFEDNKTRILIVASAGALLLVAMFLQWKELIKGGTLAMVFLAPTLLAGSLVFPKAFRALKQRMLDMNVLMTVAAVGAFAIKEYSEAATVVFLFSLAELLESYSLSRARNAIRAVMKLTPQLAHLKTGSNFTDKQVSDVFPDHIIQVRPGESIPLDGVVVSGQTTVNESALTGESMPVEKNPNDKVFAGTVNSNGTIEIQVTQGFKDTKLSKILSMIEDAQSKKAPSERFVDRFAKIYTPAVFVLAYEQISRSLPVI
jgi:Cd2+/Zn2+-exporting ATPase